MRTHERSERLHTGDTCTRCGYRYRPVSTTEAVAALLEIPDTYRAALKLAGEAGHTRTDTDGWTAIEYAAHAAEVLHCTHKRLVLVFEHDDREVSPPHLEAVRASARTAPPELVLASVSAACRDLALLVSAAPEAVWSHTARRDGEIVTARELLTDALHEAHHHAHDARAASGSPITEPRLVAAGQR